MYPHSDEGQQTSKRPLVCRTKARMADPIMLRKPPKSHRRWPEFFLAIPETEAGDKIVKLREHSEFEHEVLEEVERYVQWAQGVSLGNVSFGSLASNTAPSGDQSIHIKGILCKFLSRTLGSLSSQRKGRFAPVAILSVLLRNRRRLAHFLVVLPPPLPLGLAGGRHHDRHHQHLLIMVVFPPEQSDGPCRCHPRSTMGVVPASSRLQQVSDW
jgi:hypothetical protein